MNLTGLTPSSKVQMFVSPKLRQFAKGQPCTLLMPWCNRDWNTTVLCHCRWFTHAGAAQKPHDFHAFHACSECHRREQEAGWDDVLRAVLTTQTRVYEEFVTLTP